MLIKYKTSFNSFDLAWAKNLQKCSLFFLPLISGTWIIAEITVERSPQVFIEMLILISFSSWNSMWTFCHCDVLCPFLWLGNCLLEVSVQGVLLSHFFILLLEQAAGWGIHLLLFQLSCSIKFQSAPLFFVLLPKLISCPIWMYFPYQSFLFCRFATCKDWIIF